MSDDKTAWEYKRLLEGVDMFVVNMGRLKSLLGFLTRFTDKCPATSSTTVATTDACTHTGVLTHCI